MRWNRSQVNDAAKIIAMATLFTLHIWGQSGDSPLRSSLNQYLVITSDEGKEVLHEVDNIIPGQIIEYVLDYQNVSEKPLMDLKLTGPIPAGTRYLDGTATVLPGVSPEFSIDAGTGYTAEPVIYKQRFPDGSEKEAVASVDMYTHIRWRLTQLSKKSSVELRYRVLIQ